MNPPNFSFVMWSRTKKLSKLLLRLLGSRRYNEYNVNNNGQSLAFVGVFCRGIPEKQPR